jgi:GT2 family glycosyltransferase
MSLLGMAVYSTAENKKDECLHKCLASLADTVDWKRHRLILSVNGATTTTHDLIRYYKWIISDVIYNTHNLGTAKAINLVWQRRLPDEHAIKMDDDIVIHQSGWIDLMEEAIARDSKIGIIGLKRRDLVQTTWHPDPHYRSQLIMLPHEPGQKWIHVERTDDIIGSCTMYNSELLKYIGYLRQIKQYGYDDNIACHRSHLAGFYNCFLNGIDIEHVDEGATDYQTWKHKHSAECTAAFIQLVKDFISGKESIYYNPFA